MDEGTGAFVFMSAWPWGRWGIKPLLMGPYRDYVFVILYMQALLGWVADKPGFKLSLRIKALYRECGSRSPSANIKLP